MDVRLSPAKSFEEDLVFAVPWDLVLRPRRVIDIERIYDQAHGRPVWV
jgi:hypothetical protein